jgi:hypothetical protein
MNTQLTNSLVRRAPQSVYGQQLKVKLVDATRVQEPGPTGSSWVLHYCVALNSLACEQVIVTDQKKGSGESFKRFQAQAGDLYLADRAYGVRPGIFYLREAGAEVLVRFALDNLPLQDTAGRRWDLLKRLRRLSSTQVGDWSVELAMDDQRLPGRVCAIKKSRQARLAAQKKLLNSVSNRAKIKESTWESCGYIFVFTTLALGALSATQALELYRGRWQIELVFKRLKSILSLGYLRKVDPESARSWLEGKLFVAMLIEALWAQAESFFPWGYPLAQTPSAV